MIEKPRSARNAISASAIRDRDGDGPDAGRNARAERNPEIEEGLNKISQTEALRKIETVACSVLRINSYESVASESQV